MPAEVIADRDAFAALPKTAASWLYQYVVHGCTQVESPAAYHISTGLSLLAASCSSTFVVHRPFPSPTDAGFWSLIVGLSRRSRKTQAVKVGLGILKEACPLALGADPGSEEYLAASLEKRPVQLLVYNDFWTFLENTGGDGGNPRKKLRAALTSLYDGLPLNRGLKKGGSTVESPRLSLLGACTPRHLEDGTTVLDFQGGFLGRFFIVFVPSKERTVDVAEPDDERRAWLVENLRMFGSSVMQAPCLGMTPEGLERWVSWKRAFEAEAENPQAAKMADLLSNTPLLAAKIMLLLSWDYGGARGAVPWRMDLDVVEPAIKIAELHVRSVTALGETIAGSYEERQLRRVWNALGDELEPYAVVLKRSCMTQRTFDGLLGTLRERHEVEEQVGSALPGTSPGEVKNGLRYVRRKAAPTEWPEYRDPAAPPVVPGGNVIPFPGAAPPVPFPPSAGEAAPAAAPEGCYPDPDDPTV